MSKIAQLSLLFALALASGVSAARAAITLTLVPSASSVSLGGTLTLKATVTGSTNVGLTWSVNGVTNGNSTQGMLTACTTAAPLTCKYTAPSVNVPSPNPVTIKILSKADGTTSTTATATVTDSIAVGLSPSVVTMGLGGADLFTATISGTTNTALNWYVNGVLNGNSAQGTLTGSGLARTYMAPSVEVPNPNPAVIEVASVADPAKTITASVTVTDSIAVGLSPANATVALGGTDVITATLSGSSNTALKWYVNGVLNGNAAQGTLAACTKASPWTCTYTAPPVDVPSPNPVAIEVASVADPSKTKTAKVTVTDGIAVGLSPSSAIVELGGTQVFTATLSGTTNTTLNWYVNGVMNGNATQGTLTGCTTSSPWKCTYTAPPINFPSPNPVVIEVASVADPVKTNKASVTVSKTIAVGLSPATASVALGKTQVFTASITGTSNTALNWYVNGVLNGNSALGTLTGCTTASPWKCTYTAPPASVPGPNPVVILVASAEDSTKNKTASVTVTDSITVGLSPSGASVELGGKQLITATVSGTTNTGVNWYVNGVLKGNSTLGTLSGCTTAPPWQCTYTAPAANFPSPNPVVVEVASVADPKKTNTVSVTVTQVIAVGLTPTSANVALSGTQLFTATISGATNTALNWYVNGVLDGNATQGTLSGCTTAAPWKCTYTAPSGSVPIPNPAVVEVASVADPSKNKTASVTVTPAIAVGLSPASASVALRNPQMFTATISGTSNTALNWYVNGVLHGNSTQGTLAACTTAAPWECLYTAPAGSIPGTNPVVIEVASVADPSKNKTASVTVTDPDFSLSVAPGTQTSAGAGVTSFSVSISGTGGFAGTVALSASGLPAGAAAAFSPSAVSGSGNSILTITTLSYTAAAHSTITITGTSGSLTHSSSVAFVTTNAGHYLGQMTLGQMIQELHGIQDANDNRVVPGIASLGIPLLNISNGPAGAGAGGPGHTGQATALPAPIALAATWDLNLANLYGTVAASEAKDNANGLLEGPDLNIARVPQSGRTFEAFGEDPYLTGRMAVAEIGGIQAQGVIAEAKHFAAYNQETNRGSLNEIIDERTLREIYLPAFEATVEQANVGSVMCAYNLVNGTYMCENNYLLNQILKQEWGFTGFVQSDFGATRSTVAAANAGLDLEMPSGIYFAAPLETAVSAGQVAQSVINDKLNRRFSTMMNLGVFDNPPDTSIIPYQQDGVISRQIAEAGMVLLENNGGILPLNAISLGTIAVIGPYAGAAMTGGGGTSYVSAIYSVTPVAGIQNRVGPGVTVTYDPGSTIASAVAVAQAASVAIVMVGDSECEGSDDSISLGGNQDQLVKAIVAANPNTIVVMKSGTAILMPWASSVPAILQAWYPGEEDGNAVAAVLFGDVNPSGKLPLTIPQQLADLPASTPAQYPGLTVNGVPTATYSEGIFVGYRHYDENGIAPLFPFGFGLSYTNFSFQNLAISPSNVTFTSNPNQTVTVSFSVTNTGAVAGAEVAQLYVGIPSTAVPEPPKSLQGFQKVALEPQQTTTVQLTLGARSFSYWDVNSESWLVVPGTYQIMVGSSSRDIWLQGQITIQ